MNRIPLIDPKTASGSNKDVFDAFQKSIGVVPNTVRAMANSPAVAQGFAQFTAALGTASLSNKIRQQISLLTSEVNSCDYCLSAHSALAKMAGVGPKGIEGARNGHSEDPKTEAALTFARAVITTSGGVTESHVADARRGGLSNAELTEIVATLALTTFTNYLNKAFDVEIEFPKVSTGVAAH